MVSAPRAAPAAQVLWAVRLSARAACSIRAVVSGWTVLAIVRCVCIGSALSREVVNTPRPAKGVEGRIFCRAGIMACGRRIQAQPVRDMSRSTIVGILPACLAFSLALFSISRSTSAM